MIDTGGEIEKLEATVRKPRARKTEKRAEEPDRLRLRQVRSGISTPSDQKATLRALGFRRIGEEILRPDHPAIRGMVRKVRHLVEIVKN